MWYIWTTFVRTTFLKSIIFNVKNTFEPNVLKWIIKTIFIDPSCIALLIIYVKIIFNFQKEWCTFGRKKEHLKKTRNVHSDIWMFWACKNIFKFVSSFEHVKFAVNGKYSQKIYENPNYYIFLVIFQTYKNAILKNVHSPKWFLWLWFYPYINMIKYLLLKQHTYELLANYYLLPILSITYLVDKLHSLIK